MSLQHIGNHQFADRFRTDQALDARAYVTGHPTHGCAIAFSLGVTDIRMHIQAEDARAIGALLLQTADEADTAAGTINAEHVHEGLQPTCPLCADTQTIWDQTNDPIGRYAPCPRCCPADYQLATGHIAPDHGPAVQS